ncbi:MAG: hypothetical protein ACI4U3_04760 [Traorella sp.]
MDVIKTRKDQTQLHILCKDHIPNFAMKNEFQTNSFSLKVNLIEIHEEAFYGYIIENGGVFLCFDMIIKNITNEKLILSKDEFVIFYDSFGPYEPEEYFNVENQFHDVINIEPFSEILGKYVYIIDKNSKKIVLKYFENYDDLSMK